MQSHVFTCIHYLVVGTSGYCWMQVYHRYVLGLYRIFEARMNCDRGTALCWPVMAGDHFQLSPRPLRELCVCDLSENMDELNRFQMEVEQSSAWYIFDIIWHFESFWCIRSFVRFIVMFLHSAVGLERSGGGRFDAALLAWCPQVHNRKLLTRLTTFRIHQNSICGYLQPLYVDRWPLMTLCIYIYVYIWLYIHIHMIICIYIYMYVRDGVCHQLSSVLVCVRRLGARTIRMLFRERASRWAHQCGSGCLPPAPLWSLLWHAELSVTQAPVRCMGAHIAACPILSWVYGIRLGLTEDMIGSC